MSDVATTCRDINELKPVAQQACRLFLKECKKAGLDIFITETYRSQARQNYLYEQGRTRPGNKVTWTRNSRHTSRLAWDIAVNPPKDLYDSSVLKQAGTIAKRLGIIWGGSWTDSPDMPHFEVQANWKAPANMKVETEEEVDMEKATVKVNGTKIDDGVLIDGTAYVPLRSIGNAIGAKIGWDNKTKTATLDTK